MSSSDSQTELEMKSKLVPDHDDDEQEHYALYSIHTPSHSVSMKLVAIIFMVVAITLGVFFSGYAAGVSIGRSSVEDSNSQPHPQSAYQFKLGEEEAVIKPFQGNVPLSEFLQCRSVLIRGTITCMPTNPLLTPKGAVQFFLYQYQDDVSIIFTTTGPLFGNVISNSSDLFRDLGSFTLSATVSVEANVVPMGDLFAQLVQRHQFSGTYSAHIEAETNACDGISFQWRDDGLSDASFYFENNELVQTPDLHILGDNFAPVIFHQLPSQQKPLNVKQYDGEYKPLPTHPEFEHLPLEITGSFQQHRRSLDIGLAMTMVGPSSFMRRSANSHISNIKELTGQELGLAVDNLDEQGNAISRVTMMLDSTTNNGDLTWVYHIQDLVSNQNFSLNYFMFDAIYNGVDDTPVGQQQFAVEVDSFNATGHHHGVLQMFMDENGQMRKRSVSHSFNGRQLGGDVFVDQWVIDAVTSAMESLNTMFDVEDGRRNALCNLANDFWEYVTNLETTENCGVCQAGSVVFRGIQCARGVFNTVNSGGLALVVNGVSMLRNCGMTVAGACNFFDKCGHSYSIVRAIDQICDEGKDLLGF